MASAVARHDRDRDREGERERDRHRQRRSSPPAAAGARDGHSSRRETSPLAKKREREEEGERGSRHRERDRERERERDDEGKKRHHRHSRHRSRSPRDSDRELRRHQPRERDAPPSLSSPRQHTTPLPHDPVAQMNEAAQALEAKQKQQPSFELSGKLAEETNKVRGVALIFTEPPEARKPDIRWRLYVFKGGDVLNEPLYVHRQSCYLFGRERRVADIPTDHPSCSKQHAVLQYRQVEKEQPDGMMEKQVRPYLMDLESTNGTFINDNRLEPRRYYELFEKDTIRFGNSSREYVLLHENSA